VLTLAVRLFFAVSADVIFGLDERKIALQRFVNFATRIS
jgi:hypothetical protein